MRASSFLSSMVIGLSVSLSFLMVTPVRADVIPVDSMIHGKTYGEWAGEWWNWAVHEPDATNAITDTTGEDAHLNQSGPVWFLAGTFGFDVVRDVTVPEGKTLFFPLLNSLWWVPEDGATEAEVRALANAQIDPASVLYATVDGSQVLNVFSYRAESPAGGFVLEVPAGSILTESGYDPGDRDPAVADGYWVALEPLSVGDHVVRFVAAVGDPGAPDFELDVTYNVHVPEPSTFVLLFMGAIGFAGYGWRRRRR